ncbi:MAG: hypothetical protein HZC36_06025 [Armatimonadetes bacterium]|nr:hypothetical protein [Armatimonadota bacterium]
MLEPTSHAPPPAGFLLEFESGSPVIRYRPKGMGCAIAFFIVWILGWTGGCIALLASALARTASGPTVGFVMLFWATDVLVILIFLWLFRSQTVFRFSESELIWTKSLGKLKRRKCFPKSGILAVRQVKDGGDGEDSFPSWGLMLVGPDFKVLSRQDIGKSDWLGPLLAQWAGKPYEACRDRGGR